MYPNHSPVSTTFSVWNALFLREVASRITGRRAAWLWLLLEPVIHIAFFLYIFAAIRIRHVGGVDSIVWLTIGLLAFFMFRRTAVQSMGAVDSNKVFFAYRQILPVDTVLVRVVVEGFLMILVSIILIIGIVLIGFDMMPADPLAVLQAVFGLWLLGAGFGLIGSVLEELVPETGVLIRFALRPLYFASGVMFSVAAVSQPYRDWLLLNPIVHGLEATRLAFAPHYHAIPELNIGYLYFVALAGLFLGFALHVRYATRLNTQ